MKDIYPQKKEGKLLMNWHLNSIIMKFQETAEITGDLFCNKIAKVSNNSKQNNSETVTNENDKEIPKEKYLSPKNYW